MQNFNVLLLGKNSENYSSLLKLISEKYSSVTVDLFGSYAELMFASPRFYSLVVITSAGLHDLSARDTIADFRKKRPGLTILVMTDPSPSTAAADAFLDAGAADYFTEKSLHRFELLLNMLTDVEMLRHGAEFYQQCHLGSELSRQKQSGYELSGRELSGRGLSDFFCGNEQCTIWDNSLDAMVLMDKDLVVKRTNRAFVRLISLDKGRILGNPLVSLLRDTDGNLTELLKESLNESKAVTGVEVKLKLSESEEKWFDAATVVQLLENKNEISLLLMLHDITEKKLAQIVLQESEKRFRNVFEKSPIGIGINIKDMNLMANPAAVRMFGFSDSWEFYGQSIYKLIAPESHEFVKSKMNSRHITGDFNDSYEIMGLKKDGTKFPFRVDVAYFTLPEGFATIVFFTDITEQKEHERMIGESLKEKEILLKEIHHRVKNNLQIISSLQNLQSEYIKDPVLLGMFNDSKNRIKTMALIHERLYHSHNLSSISFAEYVSDLVSFLLRSYTGHFSDIKLEQSVEDLNLSLDVAIPCGLIINELISNALKYAFTEITTGGIISIIFHQKSPAAFELMVADNGVGIPENIDFRNTNSLGLQLVCNLVEQLGGTIELGRSNGTKFTIEFDVKMDRE